MYYARLDRTMIGKKEYSHGFANTKQAYAFETKAMRDLIVECSFDLSAKVITRKEALKYAEPIYGDRSNGLGIEIYTNMENDCNFYKVKE